MARKQNRDGYKQKTKISSKFGIYLPPRKKRIYPQVITFRFILTGNLPSKKNNWVPASNIRHLIKKAGNLNSVSEALAFISERHKNFIRKNKDYEAWEIKTKQILVEQAAVHSKTLKKHGLMFPLSNCRLHVYAYWKNNIARDNSGGLESIQDILVDCGIIINDPWQNLTPIGADAEWYPDEINENIIVIDLSVNIANPVSGIEDVSEEIVSDEGSTIPIILKTQKAISGIEKEDLMVLGWLEDGYDDENDNATYIDATPDFDEWSEDEIIKVQELGYSLDALNGYYSGR